MTLPQPYYNDNKNSFAYPTVHKRWPLIITGAIRDVETEIATKKRTGGEEIVTALNKLLADFKADKPVDPFPEQLASENSDLRYYNASLAALNSTRKVTWLTGPWLYLECYLYQYIHTLMVGDWSDFDVFETLKNSTFQLSELGVTELSKRYQALSKELENASEGALEILFKEFIDISLWGNATDLSLLAGNVSLEDIQSVQGAEVRKKNEQYIIVNDLPQVWEKIKSKNKRIDIVLDNSGFELFADLAFSLFALDSGLAKEIHIHCKEIPWFVSDTMPKDFNNLLHQLIDKDFYKTHDESLTYFHDKVEAYVKKGSIKVGSHPFWTLDCNYWQIPKFTDLYENLSHSDLVIFKGDLNYRKLTGDLEWDPTTPFVEAIQDLADSGLKVLSLRTCKADVVVGLPKGLHAELAKKYAEMGEDGKLWASSGKWAVISYSGGKK